jgi:hypothetical protein
MATRKREPQYIGTFYGIKNGKIYSVQQTAERDGIWLSGFSENNHHIRHGVMKGRTAQNEIVVVFGLSDIEFVHAGLSEDRSKQVIEKLKKILEEKT